MMRSLSLNYVQVRDDRSFSGHVDQREISRVDYVRVNFKTRMSKVDEVRFLHFGFDLEFVI